MRFKLNTRITFFCLFSLLILTLPAAHGELYPLDPTSPITPSDGAYDYEMTGLYDAYFNTNPAAGYPVMFTFEDHGLSLLPHSLQYRNDNNDLQYISGPSAVTGGPNGQFFIYPDAYGPGLTLYYEATTYQVKERLSINSFSDLPALEAYMLPGGNPVLELAFQLGSSDGRIFLDGVEWDQGSTVYTEQDVTVTDADGKLL